MENLNILTIQCNENLNNHPEIRKYLNDRKLDDETIEHHKLGIGEFYGRKWITIPIPNAFGETLFFKLRKLPTDDGNQSKYLFYPEGSEATIYGWELLLEEKDTVCINEGEFDSLVLRSYGVIAVTSTAGSNTFRKEWVQAFKDIKRVYTLFDFDESGELGAKKIGQILLEELPGIEVYNIVLPELVGEHGDVTDYFVKNGNLDKLFNDYSHKVFLEKKPIPQKRVWTENSTGKNEITTMDIELAKNTNCNQFVTVVRKDYDGKTWAHCPFGHEDKTPSFCCYPAGSGYSAYCCGNAGDTIDLVMKLYNLPFVEAVKFIVKK